MSPKQVFENNEKWVAGKLDLQPDYFEKMAKGQSPDFLYIGCSDSRVTAEEMMGLEPGQAFVTRNIANMVNNLDMSVTSVLEYGVGVLKVKHLVVCGHYYCGGVKAAMGSDDLGILNPWLKAIRDVYRLHREELEAIADEEDRYKRLVELNVQEQCVNLMKNPVVQKAYRAGDLQIHGWVFDIATGKIIDLGVDIKQVMRDFDAIYHIV